MSLTGNNYVTSGNFGWRISLSYGEFENQIATKFHRVVSLLDSEQANNEFKKMIKTNEWADKETTLLLHLTLTLIRSPQVKSLIYDNEKLPNLLKPIFYRLTTTSPEMAVKLAEDHLIGADLEIALQFLKTGSESGLKLIAEHLLNTYQLRVYKTKGEQRLFLSDSPILIKEFEDTDYLFPISPNTCVGTTRIQIKEEQILTYNQIIYLTDNEIDKINKRIIQNTKKTLIVQNSSDINFVEKALKNT